MIALDRHPIDMVWLDLDDTLVDFRSASREALRWAFDEERLDRFFVSPQAWTACYEKHNYALWQQYSGAMIGQQELRLERFRLPLCEAGMARDIATAVARRLDPAYLEQLAEATRLLPGALELVGWFRDRGVKVGILSNGFTEVQHRKLEVCGLAPLIDIMVLSDDIGINKPDRRIFDHAMQTAGYSSPERMLMIGDNATTDIAGAVAAGWQAILFDSSLPLLSTRAVGYTMVSDLAVIPSLLDCGPQAPSPA